MAVQAILDSVSAALILIFASLITNLRIGITAGLLIAFSPHLGYSSLFVSPESMFALPVILAVASLYLAVHQRKLRYYIAAGVCVGLACWLRSNGIALSPFLAVFAFLISTDRRSAAKGGVAMILATAAVIAPITVRNYMITGRFIPLSVGFGVILMQSVADYDFDGRYGLPKLDPDVAVKEAEWYNRPDYAKHFLRPDGIERDNARIWRTLDVIKDHPLFYASTIARRVDFMLRYDLPPGPNDWPFNTATPVYISKYALASQRTAEAQSGSEIWSVQPQPTTQSTDLRFDVPVEPSTNYVLEVDATASERFVACSVLSEDEKNQLAAEALPLTGTLRTLKLSFSSQGNSTLRIAFLQEPPDSPPTMVDVSNLRLIRIGRTEWAWTNPIRAAVRGIQRNLYTTPLMRVLVLLGLGALLVARRLRLAAWIAAVPLYYLLFQSLLHTEYRYIVPMHYFLFVFAAIGVVLLWNLAASAFSRAKLNPPHERK
jgi:hypothetical protein